MSVNVDMLVRTPKDIGALIRDRRRRLGLDQRALAERVGVSRQWVIEVERGKPRVELDLVLRTLEQLGLRLDVGEDGGGEQSEIPEPPDIDAIVRRARERS